MRVKASHLLRAVNYILEYLVERVTHMKMSVRIGRSIVQDKLLSAQRLFAQFCP